MHLICLALVLVVFSTSGIASPYTLKCTPTSVPDRTVDLTVDLDRKEMVWGPQRFAITHITDRYITAIENIAAVGKEVGGEVWVLDRVTGDYKGAIVGMFCKEPSCRTGSVLQAFTSLGRCFRPIL
jgi:hypothetical protein